MSEPYLGEIRMFGGNFAPRGWALCNGQLIAIAQNAALFSLLGTNYGGDGVTTFAVPDLRGRAPIHWGSGPGLTPRVIGEVAGTESTTLAIPNMPAHTHTAVFTPSGGAAAQVNVTATVGTLASPVGNLLAQAPAGGPSSALIYAPADSTVGGQLSGVSGGGGGGGTVTVGVTGGSNPVGIMQPFLAVTFIIATSGIFPSRN